MDVVVFGQALTELTVVDIRAIASDLHEVCVSTADEIANTRSMLMIEQTLRRKHRLHDAALAALSTATKVQEVALHAEVELPDKDVTRVARAAAQLARGMVVGDHPGIDLALHTLGRGWHRLPCVAEFQAA
ncbi:MAG: hypothetical protein JWM72_1982 [Actinomycetia bacterium]|nr:hypothetical protein [Actinomycetes bacterium]